MSLAEIKNELRLLVDSNKTKNYQRYFKTAKGEYGEGDIFLGVTVPNTRKVAKKHSDILLGLVEKLLKSKFHEERLLALLILIDKFNKCSDEKCKKEIFNTYLTNLSFVNNWDLVDVSAHKIIGAHLEMNDRGLLYEFARSNNLWKKRISIISTFWFIQNYDFKDTLRITEILLCDDHDLIHKAVGWALREVGKKNRKVEEKFLQKHYKRMPRTMLRYAIEKFPESLRQKYLKGKI